MVGRTVGNYRFLEKIGEGGTGVVYRAVDLPLDRVVAIKALRPDFRANAQVVTRFRSEAQTLARLHHPHIALLYSLVEQEDQLWMVMEYVAGQTFSALVRQHGRLPAGRAISLLLQALDGVGYAHSQGVIHRDIKASNLMWSEAQLVKVMDFGIAIALGSSRVTRLGHMVGTLQYMSPEQVRGKEMDARSDIYSLGILLYHLLAGQVPFRSENDYELMRAQVDTPPAPLVSHGVRVPEALEAVLHKALAKDPAARFPDTAAFGAALEPILAQLPAEPPDIEVVRPLPAACPDAATTSTRVRPGPGARDALAPAEPGPEATDRDAEPWGGALPDTQAIRLALRLRLAEWMSWQRCGAAAALLVLLLSVNLLIFGPFPRRAPEPPASPGTAASAAPPGAASPVPDEELAWPGERDRAAWRELGWAAPGTPSSEPPSAPRARETAPGKPPPARPLAHKAHPPRRPAAAPREEGQRWIIRR